LPEDMIESPGPQIGPDFSYNGIDDEEGAGYKKIGEGVMSLSKDIDLDDLGRSYDRIIKKIMLGGSSRRFGEDVEREASIMFGLVVNHLQNERRKELDRELAYNKDNLNRFEKREIHSSYKEMAMRDSDWMYSVEEMIYENRKNPEVIKKFWQDYEKFYADLEREKENKDIFDDERARDKIKFGILAELAAKDLLKKVEDVAKELKIPGFESLRIEIQDSSARDDVTFKTDFYARVSYMGIEKMIPVQVKSCNISTGVSSYEDETSDKDRKRFVLDNVFERLGKDAKFSESQLSQRGYKGTTFKRKKRFINSALGDHQKDEGYFIIIPRGSEKKEGEFLHEDGTVSGTVEKEFIQKFFKDIFKIDYEKYKNN
ncbi:MAG: hypothetical protein WA063_00310, partial [Minisyncoccia bacterium]